jgi:ABC-type lipoprotein export system ATPase subunit
MTGRSINCPTCYDNAITSTDIMILLHEVEKSFDHGRIVALKPLSVEIASGEHVAILGRSGSGKSTLLNLMCGLDTPDAGKVVIDGVKVQDADHWARLRAATIGIVFQHFCLLPTFSVRENIEFAMMPTVTSANARATRAHELIGRFGLGHAGAQFPPTLSGGERQRAAIARAIANRPRLLLADEPTGSLDSESGAVIMDHLCSLNRELGCTLVIITHDPAVAALAHRQITLHDGRVTKQSTVSAE